MQLEIVTRKQIKATGDITTRVKSFEDACEVLGIDGSVLSGSLHDSLDQESRSITAFTKLLVIARALNEGWKPDWNNRSEYKWYPWFEVKNGALVLDDVHYYCTGTYAGSRLCFKTEALGRYAGTQFNELYKDLIIQ